MANYRSFLQAAGESRGPCIPRTAQASAEASHGGIRSRQEVSRDTTVTGHRFHDSRIHLARNPLAKPRRVFGGWRKPWTDRAWERKRCRWEFGFDGETEWIGVHRAETGGVKGRAPGAEPKHSSLTF